MMLNEDMDNFIVENDGIYKRVYMSDMTDIKEPVIPREVFVEAFNKYIRFQPTGQNLCLECSRLFSNNDGSDVCPSCGSTKVDPLTRIYFISK